MDERIEKDIVALLPRLRRFAFTLTGSWPDADDLVQETCARAIERLDQWQIGTRLDSWMYRIAQNLHYNRVRKDRTRANHLREVGAFDADPAAERVPLDRLALQDLEVAILRLPPEQRTVLLLVAVEGRSYGEAGEMLDLSPGTVASRVSRARSTLAEMMDGGP